MKHQRGVALITAMLVVALASIAAAAILTSANVAIHRSTNLIQSEKGWWYVSGVEAWIKTILQRDAEDNSTDSLQDAWAKPVDYLPVDEGYIRGTITDLHGRFNLNNLGIADPQQYTRYREQFERLLQNIEGADPFQARAIADAVRDWVDADSEPTGFNGGEDAEYLGFNPPYRVANQPMQSVSELLAVKGMTRELYARLLPHVAALPETNTPVNINTATEPVLRSLVKQATPELEKFLRERADTPSEDVSAQQTAFGPETPPISVNSRYFMLRTEAFIGSGRTALYSFYLRPQGGAPIVLGRSTDTE